MPWAPGLAARASCSLPSFPTRCWELLVPAGSGSLSSRQAPPAPEGSPADLQLAGRIKRVRRRARIGWARTLLQLAAEFNQEAPL